MENSAKEIECISCKSAFCSDGDDICHDCMDIALGKDGGDLINECDDCGSCLGDDVFCACEIV